MLPEVRRTAVAVRVPRVVALKRLPIPRQRKLFDGNDEPRLDEIIDDPIVRCLLASDGIAVNTLEGLLSDVKNRLDRRRMLS
jgi:hypothetical protein